MSLRERLKPAAFIGRKFDHKLLDVVELPAITTDSGRFYTAPDNTKLPSVTTVLSRAFDDSWLQDWKNRVGEEEANRVSGRARTRGTALHNLIESYLLGEEGFLDGAMPQNAVSFKSMAPHLDKHVGTVFGVELPLWSKRLCTAGRTDLFAEWDGIPSIIDWKTASKPKEASDILSYFQQSSCYGLMVEERYRGLGVRVPQVVIGIAVEHDEPQFFVRKKSDYVEGVLDTFITQRTRFGI